MENFSESSESKMSESHTMSVTYPTFPEVRWVEI